MSGLRFRSLSVTAAASAGVTLIAATVASVTVAKAAVAGARPHPLSGTAPVTARDASARAPAHRPTPKRPPRAMAPPRPEEITVSAQASATGMTGAVPGGGLMPRQTAPYARNTITRDYIAAQSPTTNVLNLVRNTPGVVVATADPTGATDRMSVSMRGMNQNEIGYEFEGMNPSDVLYYSPASSTWADTENIGSITVSPGSPDLMAPTFSAVGGLISATMRSPSPKAGGLADFTFGGNDLEREFIRGETGEIGHSGVRSYASFSNTTATNWRGPGGLNRWHVDFKGERTWGDGNSISPFMSYNDVTENLYTYPTLAQWRQYGDSYNYAPNFTGSNTDYYKFHQYEWRHAHAGVQAHLNLGHGLALAATPYLYDVDGTLNGATALSRTGSYLGSEPAGILQFPPGAGGRAGGRVSNQAAAVSVDHFTESTFGLNTALTWTHHHNALSLGYWYSYVNYTEDPSYSLPGANGQAANLWGRYPVLTQDGRRLLQWNAHVIQQLNALTLQDTYRALDDRLTVSAGLKAVMITRMATNLIPGATYATGFSDFQPLPRVAISYQATPRDQVYVNGTTAFREAAAVTPSIDMFSVATGRMTSAHSSDIKPEYSIAEEIGFRHYGAFNLTVSLFNYNFTNRQVTSNQLVNGTTITSSLNGGGQTTRGASAEFSLPAWHHVAPYLSGQYLHATIDNDIAAGGDYLPTRGKSAVLTPTFMGSIGLSYDDGSLFGNFSFNYVDSQYTTFMDDQSMPAYKTANVSLGYRLHSVGALKRPQIQLNLINVGDARYLSGAWGLTSNAVATRGIYGHMVAASQPTYITGGKFSGVVSLTTGF